MNGIDRDVEGESAAFWQHPFFRGMGLLRARFRRHRYELHTHPTFVVALITGGCEQVRIGRRREVAPAGTVLIVNPEECHDGEAGCEDGWAYRTFYPPIDLVAEVARELGQPPLPAFRRSVVDDPVLVRHLVRAHRSAEASTGEGAEETMLVALRRLVVRHADARRATRTARDPAGAARRVAAYRDMVEGDLTSRFELARLAEAAGVTRFQVIRDFKQVTGFTPTAYVRDRRLRSAVRLIQRGAALADAAASAGFADQSHLSRAFKLSHGFTPGALRRACASAAGAGRQAQEGRLNRSMLDGSGVVPVPGSLGRR